MGGELSKYWKADQLMVNPLNTGYYLNIFKETIMLTREQHKIILEANWEAHVSGALVCWVVV